jgi:outer membrane lipoprotein-sorting protein
MRIATRLFCLISLIVVLAQTVSAQTADEIVEKALAAAGGRAALGKLKSRYATGTVALSTPLGELPGNVEIWNEAPNKSRNVMKVDLSAGGLGMVTVDQRFNGEAGYVLDSLQGNREVTGSPLDSMKGGSFPTPFLGFKERGASVELAGKEKVGDRDAYVLNYKPKIGSPVRWYVDAASYLPVRSTVKVTVPQLGSDVEQTTDYSDYREVDGVKLPFKVKNASQLQTYTITFTKIEHNVSIDEASFSKPAAGK